MGTSREEEPEEVVFPRSPRRIAGSAEGVSLGHHDDAEEPNGSASAKKAPRLAYEDFPAVVVKLHDDEEEDGGAGEQERLLKMTEKTKGALQ